MVSRRWRLAVVATALLAVGGCAQAVEQNPETEPMGNLPFSVRPHTVRLPDGRNVLCIWEGTSGQESGGGGVTCDWDHAYVGNPIPFAPVLPTEVPTTN